MPFNNLGDAGLTSYAARWTGCDWKQVFPSEGAAEASIRSLKKRGLCREDRIHAYYCKRHGGWHTGHRATTEVD